VASLVEALESRFPAAAAIVGDEFFRGMARLFVRAAPPRSPLLLAYGDDLPAFVEQFEPARPIPYLADVMRLEIACTQAYHAADAQPVAVEALGALNPSQIGEARATFHPAVRLLRSAHPVVTLWMMNSGLAPVGVIDEWAGEDALVTRGHLAVSVHRLPAGGFAFLSKLHLGGSFGEAIEAALAQADDFDVEAALAGLVTRGIATVFRDR
ncbi:MAG: HvfC/BufC family peptide modification chaperone, partial [Bradyrhizobium sp.]